MAEEKKSTKSKKDEKDEKDEKEPEEAPSLEELVLNRKTGKYKIVDRISYWAKELRKLEEHRHLTQTEILELAMTEVLSGKVDEDELEKKVMAAVSANGAKKDADRAKKKF